VSPISNEITANDPLLFAMLTVSERRSDSVSVPGEFEAAEARVKVTPLVIADPLQLVPGKFAQRAEDGGGAKRHIRERDRDYCGDSGRPQHPVL
jgi:hypothetical protein